MQQEFDAMQIQNSPAAVGNPVSLPPSDTPLKRRLRLNVLQWLALLGLAGLSYFGVSHVGFQVVEVVGTSMQPTLRQSDHYLLKKWVYLFRPPHRKEIVVIHDPQDGGFSVKRVVAVGGETVDIRDGDVFINGQKLDEPYLPAGTPTYGSRSLNQEYQCGPDEYFVLGDNRTVSVDSRLYGPVPRHNVLGLIAP